MRPLPIEALSEAAACGCAWADQHPVQQDTIPWDGLTPADWGAITSAWSGLSAAPGDELAELLAELDAAAERAYYERLGVRFNTP